MEGIRGTTRYRASTLALAAGLALGVSACGGDDPEIEDAAKGQPFRVAVSASFPERQRLAAQRTLEITVRNQDSRPLPDVAVVLNGLERRIASEDNGAGRIADPRRPIWIVDQPPAGGQTAYVDTWALGALPAGAERTFRWKLTPTVAGRHKVRWRVAAAVEQNGAVRASGGRASGTFDVRIDGKPEETTIDPDTGKVVPAT